MMTKMASRPFIVTLAGVLILAFAVRVVLLKEPPAAVGPQPGRLLAAR